MAYVCILLYMLPCALPLLREKFCCFMPCAVHLPHSSTLWPCHASACLVSRPAQDCSCTFAMLSPCSPATDGAFIEQHPSPSLSLSLIFLHNLGHLIFPSDLGYAYLTCFVIHSNPALAAPHLIGIQRCLEKMAQLCKGCKSKLFQGTVCK